MVHYKLLLRSRFYVGEAPETHLLVRKPDNCPLPPEVETDVFVNVDVGDENAFFFNAPSGFFITPEQFDALTKICDVLGESIFEDHPYYGVIGGDGALWFYPKSLFYRGAVSSSRTADTEHRADPDG